MHKRLLLITLITTAYNFGAQTSTPNIHSTRQTDPSVLPLELQLRLAELKLEKTNLEIAKGPTTNYKDLIVPALGMGAGLWGIVNSGTGVINNKKIADTHGAALLVSLCIFAVSYWQFKSGDKNEVDHLHDKKEAQKAVIEYLRRQQFRTKPA